jgi:hypothetical protein
MAAGRKFKNLIMVQLFSAFLSKLADIKKARQLSLFNIRPKYRFFE